MLVNEVIPAFNEVLTPKRTVATKASDESLHWQIHQVSTHPSYHTTEMESHNFSRRKSAEVSPDVTENSSLKKHRGPPVNRGTSTRESTASDRFSVTRDSARVICDRLDLF